MNSIGIASNCFQDLQDFKMMEAKSRRVQNKHLSVCTGDTGDCFTEIGRPSVFKQASRREHSNTGSP